jgi:hypothetical protein|tara:strand:- start:102 stop:680 length:579 start_codon:yes stop_codon:yes gene_type:complete
MASILKVNTIQDATNSNTALTISSTGEIEQTQMTVAMFAPSDNHDASSGTITMGSSSHKAWISLNDDSDWSFKNIGSPPTFDSNGIFTFPSTGVYEINHMVGWYGTNDLAYAGSSIDISENSGGAYSSQFFYTQLENYGATGYASVCGFLLVNVTDASTFRARFRLDHSGSVTVRNKYYSKTTFKKIASVQT